MGAIFKLQFPAHYVLTTAIACLSLWSAFAHGDLHQRIDQLSAELARKPSDPVLRAKRAELRRQHQEWPGALADIRLVTAYSDDLSYHCLEAMILLESGKPSESKLVLDRILKHSPTNSVALVARAQAHALLQEHLAAVKDYSAAAAILPHPSPDIFIEQARCLARAGDRPAAVEILVQAVARLGSLPSLQRYALDLELELGRYDAALARLSALETPSKTRFDLMQLRGEILLKADRRDEARKVLATALSAIESQPARMNPRIQATRTAIRVYLQEL